MTVNELIEALQALPEDQRTLDVIFVDVEWGDMVVSRVVLSTMGSWKPPVMAHRVPTSRNPVPCIDLRGSVGFL